MRTALAHLAASSLPLLLLAACPGSKGAPPPAASLAFTAEPLAGTRGQPLGALAVVALDAQGRPTRAFQGPVTLSLRGGAAGASLVGTSALGGAGPWDFGDVAIDRPGVGYQVVASGPGLPEVASRSFPVGTPPAAAAGAQPWEVRVGDLDGDGRLDVVTANYSSKDLTLLRGGGDGTLTHLATVALAGSPSDLALADLDGDGHLDLVVTQGTAGKLLVLRGRGDGTFEAPVERHSSAGCSTVRVADLDGDGRLDLLVVTSAGLEALRGRGDGTFLPAVVSAATDLSQLEVADLDEDGLLDAISADWLGYGVQVRLGNGAGGFGTAASTPPGQELIFPKALAISDYDLDGHVDVVVMGAITDGVNVLRGDGTGALAFASSTWMEVGWVGDGRVADLDGDGRPDVVVTDWECQISVLLQGGAGSRTFFAGARTVGLALADLDGDGHLDAITGDDWFNSPGSVSVLLGNGDGTFRE